MSAPRDQRGFTLVELLIAIAIFAVMAAMAYGGLSSVIATRDSVSASLARSKTLQMSLWRLQRDVEEIVDRPVRDQYGDRQPAIIGSPDTGLTFTRGGWTNPLGQTRSTLQRVQYQLDANNNLVRSYWRVLDQAQDSDTVQRVLLKHVKSVEWRYLDRNRQWQDRWPPGDNGLPGQTAGLPNTGSTLSVQAGTAAGLSSFNPPLAIELRLDTATWGPLRLLFMVPGARAASPPSSGSDSSGIDSLGSGS